MNYGAFSNHDFFVKYGFIDADNPFDFFRIPIRLHDNETTTEGKNSTMQVPLKFIGHYISDPGHVTLAGDGTPMGETMLHLRVLSLTLKRASLTLMMMAEVLSRLRSLIE